MGIFRQFPYSNFHDMNMDEIIKIVRQLADEWAANQENWERLYNDTNALYQEARTAIDEFKAYVLNYFATLDLQDEVNAKINEMVLNGSFDPIIYRALSPSVTDWLEENITVPSGVVIDSSLSIEGACADAKATGDWLRDILYRSIDSLNSDYFEKGNLDAQGNDDSYKEENRIRTVGMMCSNNNIHLIAKAANAKLTIYYYHGDGSLDFKSDWTDNVFIRRGRIFKLLLTLDPTDTGTRTIAEVMNGWHITSDSYYTDVISKADFKHGTLSASGDTDYLYGQRAINTLIVYKNTDTVITPIRSGARFLIGYYNADGSWNRASSWYTDTFVIPAYTYFRLMLDLADSNIHTVSDILNGFNLTDQDYTKYEKIIFSKDFEHVFQKGSLINGNNDSFNGNARARSAGICRSAHDIVISYKTGAYSVHFFNDSGVFTNETGWKYKDYYIPANTNFRILCTPDIHSSATFSLEQCLDCISIQLLDKYSVSGDPNIIWQCRNVDESTFPPYSKYYVQAAAHNQFDRVRFNVRITTDGEYVLIHDNTINNEARNPDGTVISETLNSDDLTYAQLNQYDWGIKYGQKYAGMTVPTLEDAAKYASLYNMGVSIETSFTPDDTQIEEMFNILAKYGCIENLIIITFSGYGFVQLEKWRSLSEYISIYIGGDRSIFNTYVNAINALKTNKSDIWCQIYPWGTVPDEAFIKKCNDNGWRLYNSTVMSKEDLFDVVGFNKGLTLIETTNIYNIKNTVREYADSQI